VKTKCRKFRKLIWAIKISKFLNLVRTD